MTTKDLTFPVIAIGSSGGLDFCHDEQQLLTCTTPGLKSGAYDGMRLITPEGRSYLVRSAERVGVAKHWWQRPLFFRLIRVELIIKEFGTVEFDRVRDLIRGAYKADRALWDSAWGEFSEFDAELTKCRTFEEVAKLFP